MGILRELTVVLRVREARRVVAVAAAVVVATAALVTLCQQTNSMALAAYTYLVVFDLLCLATCLLSAWVEQQGPSSVFCFGYERLEVLAVFATAVLAQLGALFIVKESVERLLSQPSVDAARVPAAGAIALAAHAVAIYGVRRRALDHVAHAASSSWLQEHASDVSHGVCRVVPGLSRALLPRVDPFALFATAAFVVVVVAAAIVDRYAYFAADSIAAIVVAAMTFGTMAPVMAFAARILLQTAPPHVVGQLDKALREAATLDGVLEFRNEHFWTVSLGALAGSLHVRVRRDADEQLVLAHLFDRLSGLVGVLTIQVVKDDWTRASAAPVLPPPGFAATKNGAPPPLWCVPLQGEAASPATTF